MLINLIRAEGYRALRMKSTYILAAVLVLLTLFSSMIYLKIDFLGAYGINMDQLDQMVQDGDEMDAYMNAAEAGANLGLNIANGQERNGPWGKGLMYYEDVPELFQKTIVSLNSLIVLAIFIGIFLGDIYSHSLDKNYLLASGRREKLFAARAIVIGFYTLGSHIVAYLATVLSAALMAESVKLNIDKSAILYFVITLFITYAFAMLIMTVCSVTGSKVAGITSGVILSTGLVTNVINVVDYIVKEQFDLESDFSIGNYTITANLGAIDLHTSGDIVTRALVCASVYLVLFIVADIVVARKKDIV